MMVSILGILVLAGCASPLVSTETLRVGLGEEFILHENQSAIIEPDGLEVRVTNLIYSPCPPGAECIWSGLGVVLEYRLNGQTEQGVNLMKAFGYKTEIVDTDYKTYAKLKVTKE